jgi:hypothetical protein
MSQPKHQNRQSEPVLAVTYLTRAPISVCIGSPTNDRNLSRHRGCSPRRKGAKPAHW